jgi:hypothetical protein
MRSGSLRRIRRAAFDNPTVMARLGDEPLCPDDSKSNRYVAFDDDRVVIFGNGMEAQLCSGNVERCFIKNFCIG